MSELILDRVERVLVAWNKYEVRKSGPARMELKEAMASLEQAIHTEGK